MRQLPHLRHRPAPVRHLGRPARPVLGHRHHRAAEAEAGVQGPVALRHQDLHKRDGQAQGGCDGDVRGPGRGALGGLLLQRPRLQGHQDQARGALLCAQHCPDSAPPSTASRWRARARPSRQAAAAAAATAAEAAAMAAAAAGDTGAEEEAGGRPEATGTGRTSAAYCNLLVLRHFSAPSASSRAPRPSRSSAWGRRAPARAAPTSRPARPAPPPPRRG